MDGSVGPENTSGTRNFVGGFSYTIILVKNNIRIFG